MAKPYGLYTVNYLPITATQNMWNSTYYSSSQFLADMQRAASLGFNTLRVFIPAWPPANSGYLQNSIDYPSPTNGELARLTDFCAQAATAGVKLHVTLFDHWGAGSGGQGGFGEVAGAQTWAAAVVGALDLSQVVCIELQNEMRFALTNSYPGIFDSGWPGYPTVPSSPTYGQVMTVWAQQMIPYLRTLASSTPIVISCTNYEGIPGDLASAVSGLTGSALPDWFEWHCYTTIAGISASLQGAIDAVGDVAPLFIGEVGLSSYASGSTTTSAGMQNQVDYLQAVRWWCQQLGLPEPAPWMLLDSLLSVQTGAQAYFGLIDTSYTVKPSGALYQKYPPGHLVPALDINGSMAGAIVDGNGNVLPKRWYVYKGNTNLQPITTSIDTTTYHSPGQSVLLSNFSGTSGGDNPAALAIQPNGISWPLYLPGQTYTFRVWLKGSGDVGAANSLPHLVISWYTSVGGYISGTNGSVIDLSSGNWVKATLSSTMPSNAGYAVLFVLVGYGSGQVWADDAEWAGPNGRMLTNQTAHYRK